MSATPMMVECSEFPDRDAALSLCAMGMGRMVVEREAPMSSKDFKFSRKVSLCSDDAHPREADVVSVAVSDDASQASSGYGDGAGYEFKGAPPLRECPIQPEMEVQQEMEVLPTAGSKQPKPKYSTARPLRGDEATHARLRPRQVPPRPRLPRIREGGRAGVHPTEVLPVVPRLPRAVRGPSGGVVHAQDRTRGGDAMEGGVEEEGSGGVGGEAERKEEDVGRDGTRRRRFGLNGRGGASRQRGP